MKICLAVRYFRNVGGMEKFSLILARHLADRGHQVRVLACRGQPMDKIELVGTGAACHAPRCARDWATARQLARALDLETADVTFGEQKMWNCDILRPAGGVEDEYWKVHFRFRRFQLSLPPLCRYLAIKRCFDIAAEGAGYRDPRLRRVIVNSNLTRQQVLARYPSLEGRIVVIHEGVTTRPPAQDLVGPMRRRILVSNGLREDGITLLFVGHDFRRKGLRYVIEAVARARAEAPGWPLQLLVLGRDRAAPYRRLAARLGIGTAVAFAGSISPPDPYFAACDLFTMPTFYDPCANVVLESIGMGLPVLTTRQNGAAEVLTHGRSGWILDHPGDVERMASYLLELRHAATRSAMRAAALDAARRHDIVDKLRQVEDVFAAVADERRHGAAAAPTRTPPLPA